MGPTMKSFFIMFFLLILAQGCSPTSHICVNGADITLYQVEYRFYHENSYCWYAAGDWRESNSRYPWYAYIKIIVQDGKGAMTYYSAPGHAYEKSKSTFSCSMLESHTISLSLEGDMFHGKGMCKEYKLIVSKDGNIINKILVDENIPFSFTLIDNAALGIAPTIEMVRLLNYRPRSYFDHFSD